MIRAIGLENIRKFKDLAFLPLSRINILTGANSSGKSSIIKSLLVLEDYLNSPNFNELELNTKNLSLHRLDTIDNLFNQNTRKRSIRFLMVYEILPRIMSDDRFRGQIWFDLKFKKNLHKNSASISEITIFFGDLGSNEPLKLKFKDDHIELDVSSHFMKWFEWYDSYRDNIFSARVSLAEVDNLMDKEKAKTILDDQEDPIVKFRKEVKRELFKFKDTDSKLKSKSNNKLLKLITSIIEKNLGEPFHPLDDFERAKEVLYSGEEKKYYSYPITLYDLKHSQITKQDILDNLDPILKQLNLKCLYLDQERLIKSRIFNELTIPDWLRKLIRHIGKKPLSKIGFADKVIKYLKLFDLGEDLQIHSYDVHFHSIELVKNKKKVNLIDLGSGSQQLVMILLWYLASPSSKLSINEVNQEAVFLGIHYDIVLIEEPESNLHPSFQSKLADMFFELFTSPDHPVLIETHSEYLIRRFQILATENKDICDNVKIHYVESNNEIRTIDINKDGSLSEPLGSGFLDEAGNLAIDLHRKQRSNSKQN